MSYDPKEELTSSSRHHLVFWIHLFSWIHSRNMYISYAAIQCLALYTFVSVPSAILECI